MKKSVCLIFMFCIFIYKGKWGICLTILSRAPYNHNLQGQQLRVKYLAEGPNGRQKGTEPETLRCLTNEAKLRSVSY